MDTAALGLLTQGRGDDNVLPLYVENLAAPSRLYFTCWPPLWVFAAGLAPTQLIGLMMQDLAFTRDEVNGLMDGLPVLNGRR